ncbi:MAG TPA: hypothetical protein VK550_13885 [Polyangiaceae bacterium]|nr:hypothetical protein [Polyangiaceae bacterium]
MRRAILGAVGAGAPLAVSALAVPTPTNAMTPVQARPRFATSTAPGEIDLGDTDDVDETPMPIESPPFRRRRVSLFAVSIVAVATVAASAVIARRPGNGLFGSNEVHSTTVALTPGPQVSGPIAVTPPAPQGPTLLDDALRAAPAPARVPEGRQNVRRSTSAPSSKRTVEPAAPSAAPVGASAGENDPASPPAEAPPPPIAAVETMVAPAPPPPPRAQVPVEPSLAPALAIDPGRVSVGIGNITTSSGISGLKVRTAIAHAPFAACYKSALGKRALASALQGALKIDIDLSGHVVGASLSEDGNLPGLRACVESAARGVKVRDVDTGDGSATILLTFSPQ